MKTLGVTLALVVCLCLVHAQMHSSEESSESHSSESHSSESPESEEPLVRCRRPFCDMYCENGFVKDENGCETCTCKGFPCAEPMCANDCREFGGYKRNEHGCMNCECVDMITCEDMECSIGQFCRPDISHCRPGMVETECLPKPLCVDGDQRPPPLNPDCEDVTCDGLFFCEYGQKRDEDNCPLCDCNGDPCETHECHVGQVCELDTAEDCDGLLGCPILATCTFKSLCHHHQNFNRVMNNGEPMPDMMPSLDNLGGPLGYMPECDAKGDFRPKQCDMKSRRPECWCVDDRGQEIEGTRKLAMVGDQPTPSCEKNHTESLEVKFQALHEFDDIRPHLESLKNTVKQHLSDWLTVDEEYIDIIMIEPATDGVRVVLIHMVVRQDGKTDLPSAAFHMQDQMQRKHCNIRFNGQTMRSDPDTLEMQHRYMQPELPHEELTGQDEEEEGGVYSFCRAHRSAVLLGCVGGAIILLCLIAVICSVVLKKKRMASHQFKHKKFENYKQNLTLGGEVTKHPDDLTVEKEPAVAVISVTETDRDGSSVA